jgi:hypothetical protein
MTGPDDDFDDFLKRRKPVFGRKHDELFEPPAELDRIVLRQARQAIEGERPQRMFHGPGWGMPVALAATLLLAFTVILNVGMQGQGPVPEVTVENVAQQVEYREAAPAPAPAAEAAHPLAASAGTANNSQRREKARADVANSAANNTASAPLSAGRGGSASASREIASPMRERGAMVADAASEPKSPRGFVAEEEADRYAAAPPAAPAPSARRSAGNAPTAGVVVEDAMTGSRTVVTSVRPPPTEAERAMAKATSSPAFRRDAQTWLAEIDRLRAAGKTAEADAEQAEFKRQHRAYAVSPDR